MQIATVLYLLRGETVCLARKKRVFAVGLWNGYGGGVLRCESIADCVVRETRDESKVQVYKKYIKKIAVVTTHRGREPFFELHIFVTREWAGEPRESDEMGTPQWFPFEKLPWIEMLPDDPVWLPLVLKGERFEAQVFLSEDGEYADRIVFYDAAFIQGPA